MDNQIESKEEFYSKIVKESEEMDENLRRKYDEKQQQLNALEKREEQVKAELRKLHNDFSKMEEK